jgi:hypothetical protein
VVDEEAWYRFNTASFDQEKILSHGRCQYTVFWDADKVLVVARRDLQTHAVQALRLPQHTLTINPNDGHRNTVLGVSHEDGRLHLSWDHHNNPLRYTRSRPGFISDPPEVMAVGDFEPAQPLMPADRLAARVTYPRFVTDEEGVLHFIFRDGGSGSGDNYVHRYSAADGTWERLGTTGLFSRRGTYPPWNNSTSRNAYANDVRFDRNGRLHVTWTYREAGRTWASNHDLHYAFSDDGGATWRNNAGEPVADLPNGDPVELADPGLVVWPIPVFSWLMNQTTMVLDHAGRPHVVTFHLPSPERPAELKHSPPPDIAGRLSLYHYWRDAQGAWHENGPVAPLRRRPGVMVDADNNLIVYLAEEGRLRCHIATASSRWTRWSTQRLDIPDLALVKIGKPDRTLDRDGQTLSFVAVTQTSPTQRGFVILDFVVENEP